MYTLSTPRRSAASAWTKARRVWTRARRQSLPPLHAAVFLAAVCLCGLVFGGLVAGQLNRADTSVLAQSVQQVLTAVQQQQLAAPADLWWQRMVRDAQMLGLLWLFGVSVLGLPFVIMGLFLRSFSIGFAMGFTVLQFGWRGWVVASVGIFFHQLWSLTALLCAGVLAVRFSGRIVGGLPVQRMPVAFIRYTGGFILCLGGLMVGAAVQAYWVPQLLHRLL
ncbi:MAG: stage II sporulation protein M [Alicyclobacillus sp.]|nr:stage II sporulation protein M [Alicyclobacillus sp.]